MIRYQTPANWSKFDPNLVWEALVEAKSTIKTLSAMPFQLDWVEALLEQELRREIEGTTKIEGAVFTQREFEQALSESPEELSTRSQRQARAAAETFRWIAKVPHDRPLDKALVLEIHRRIITGADDDHCEPGRLRADGQNVTFGVPEHRGVEGGTPCEQALDALLAAARGPLSELDPILQALAVHYHIAAMHPFLDGNGRTARAIQMMLLERAGLRHISFIALSNYFAEEKSRYLTVLSECQSKAHDLSAFFKFALDGIARQGGRLIGEIRHELSKAVYRNLMYDLFGRLESPKKRVIAKRQIAILREVLDRGAVDFAEINIGRLFKDLYGELKAPTKAWVRDLNGLQALGAINFVGGIEATPPISVVPNLDWPEQITQTEFFERVKNLPKAKSHALDLGE